MWKSDIPKVNAITKGEGIPFKNGYPNFSKWSKAKMKFKNLNGTTKDFDKVYERIAKQKGFKNKTQAKKYLKEKGLTPHHHQEGKTIELIPSDLHNNKEELQTLETVNYGCNKKKNRRIRKN